MNATRIMRVIVAVSILTGVLWTTEQAQSQAKKSPGATTTPQPQDKQKVQKRAGATQDKIHADVRSKLEESEDGTVYVMVTLKPLPKEGLTKEQRKAMAKEKQDKLLAKLVEDDFKVDHRFATQPRMIGHLSAAGLTKFGKQTGVAKVELSKIEPAVFPELARSETGKINVLVPLRPVQRSASTQQEAKRVVKEIQQNVLGKMGEGDFEVGYRYSLFAALTGHVNVGGLEKLAVDDDVVAVGLPWEGSSQTIESVSPPAGERTVELSESIPFLGVDEVHDLGYTGADVTVAVIGSGIDCTWPDIQNQCVAPAAFLGGSASNDHSDVTGHETYMASIIVGVAPDVKIMPVKIHAPNGRWAPQDLAAGVEHVILVKDQFPNLRIINISQGSDPPNLYWGCSCNNVDAATIIMEAALEAAKEAEIVIFASSGDHHGCGKMSAPACISYVEAVAAVYDGPYGGPITYGSMCTDQAGNPHQVVCGSDRPPVDCNKLLGAPGYQITLPSGTLPANYTGTTSGTSSATAHASGVAALMIERAGCPGPATIAGILRVTGTQAQHEDQCPGSDGVVSAVPSSIDAWDAVNAITTACTLLGEPACTGSGPGLLDVIIFLGRMTGVGVPYPPGLSTCLDFQSSPPDGDIDLHDFAQFQIAFSGTAQGACCDLGLSCSDGLEEDCTGLYLGDFTKCAEIQCEPIGACCQADGSCSLMTCVACLPCCELPLPCPCICNSITGYAGNGFDCEPGLCTQPDTGACCQQDGTCDDSMLEVDCLAANGMYQGHTILCINVTCEQPLWGTGACCMMDGSCVDDQTEAACWATGWSYQGDGSTCAADACGPAGACCMGDGSCTEDLTIAECDTAGGIYEGDAGVCSPNPCVQPAAACCDGSGACPRDMTPDACDTAGGTYQGGGTMCAGYDCSVTGACCLPGDTCVDVTAASCAFQGGLYAGDPTTCPINCSVGDDGGAVFGACQAKERTLLAANGGELYDKFGTSVSLNGSLAVVGAPNADSAYLFGLDNTDCSIEQFKFLPLVLGEAEFGFAVAVSGDTAVVVERLSSTGYVFQKPLLGWQDMFQTARLLVPDLFNTKEVRSVAINEAETVVLLGAPEDCQGMLCDCDPQLGLVDCGSVHVHHRPLFGWEDRIEDLILTAPDPEPADRFGWSVSISGSAALVGAPWEDEACGGGSGCNAGAVYVMRSNAYGWNWTDEAKLTASDAQDDDEFGTSVSISGNVALIGAPVDTPAASPPRPGSAYVFRFNPMSGQWNQEAKLTGSDSAVGDRFGISVSVSGDVAVIGAYKDDDSGTFSGTMYTFLFDGFDWNEQGKFTASDASVYDHFGISVSISGDRAIVGAQEGEDVVNNAGAAYIFEGLGDCDDTDTADVCDIINDPSIDCCTPHDCCEARLESGCSDPEIQECVCLQNAACCDREWTADCVALVEGSDPPCGSCDSGNGLIDACEGCVADLDGDGEVGPVDLAMLLATWGPCVGECPADFNSDCDVGAFDLAVLLASWGPCPLSAQGGGDYLGEGARRFAFGGGGGCLSLEAAVQMMGYENVAAFIDWILSSVPAEMVYQAAQFLLWLLTNWPC